MELQFLLSITPIYISILGLIFLVFTMRAILYRRNNRILIGSGGDAEMMRLMRGQGNFIETVPMALFLLVTMEVLGASDLWLHFLGFGLILARVAHYLGLTGKAPLAIRAFGMVVTLLIILISSIWILTAML